MSGSKPPVQTGDFGPPSMLHTHEKAEKTHHTTSQEESHSLLPCPPIKVLVKPMTTNNPTRGIDFVSAAAPKTKRKGPWSKATSAIRDHLSSSKVRESINQLSRLTKRTKYNKQGKQRQQRDNLHASLPREFRAAQCHATAMQFTKGQEYDARPALPVLVYSINISATLTQS